MKRFYCPNLKAGQTAVLEDSEAHHFLHVLRGKPGDAVELFNGAGGVAQAEATSCSRKSVDLKVLSHEQEEPKKSSRLILAAACPKGDRLTGLIEKATEIGVDEFIPLITERTVVKPSKGKQDRLQQTVISACKQSGRNFLMSIHEPTSWQDLLAGEFSESIFAIAHPGERSLFESFQTVNWNDDPTIVGCIGPEGGYSDEETELAAQTIKQICIGNLGPHIMRVETAGVVLAGLIAQFAK